MPGKHKATYRMGNGTSKINKVSSVGSSAKTVKASKIQGYNPRKG